MGIKKTMKKVVNQYVGEDSIAKFRIWINRKKRDILAREKDKGFELIKFGNKGEQSFFGYYDKTPFSQYDNMVLGNITLCGNSAPSKNDVLKVGYFDIDNSDIFNEIGETNSWCWQQGCRLQWYPQDENSLVIYNKPICEGYGSVIQNIITKEIIQTHKAPIYDINSTGEFALTLNFSRLGRLRPGYGYVNFTDYTEGVLAPKDDGVWLYDLKNKRNKLIISLDFLCKYNSTDTMEKAEHYINHLLFSPNGDRFLFFHLWTKGTNRYSRLITSDINGQDIHLLTNGGKVSHYTWKNNEEILATIHYDSIGTRYYLVNDKSKEVKIKYEEYLSRDGHPSYSCRGSLLTDTYPDGYSERSLLLIDTQGKIMNLGSYLSPYEYRGECRCDLHPRWNRAGNCIQFDSAHSGERKMYLLRYD